jgi:hypothetical protein
LALAILLASGAVPPAAALTFSAASNEPTVSASDLDAVLDIQVAGSTLTLTLSNTSTAFNLNELSTRRRTSAGSASRALPTRTGTT